MRLGDSLLTPYELRRKECFSRRKRNRVQGCTLQEHQDHRLQPAGVCEYGCSLHALDAALVQAGGAAGLPPYGSERPQVYE